MDWYLLRSRMHFVVDNTGVWRDAEGQANTFTVCNGAKKVLLTAPGSGEIKNVVFGVNQKWHLKPEDTIISAASCTTNAITPALKRFTTSLVSYQSHRNGSPFTNDQNLIDNFHSGDRRVVLHHWSWYWHRPALLKRHQKRCQNGR